MYFFSILQLLNFLIVFLYKYEIFFYEASIKRGYFVNIKVTMNFNIKKGGYSKSKTEVKRM